METTEGIIQKVPIAINYYNQIFQKIKQGICSMHSEAGVLHIMGIHII